MTEHIRQFRGVWIARDLWEDRSLSITEKVMLVEIDSLQHPERGCFARNSRFAEFFDLSVSRVSEIISGLEAKGRLTITLIREGKMVVERQIRTVGIPKTPSEKAMNPFGKGDEPPSEKAKESNTKRDIHRGDILELPPWLDPRLWDEWVGHRKEIGKRLTPNGALLNLRKLSKLRDDGNDPTQVIEQAIAAGYQGLFPVKGSRGSQPEFRNGWAALAAKDARERLDEDLFVDNPFINQRKVISHEE